MARPREFDRDKALRSAMAVFWRQGYEATSTDDLLRAMGIGRQSLYDTFGDKQGLYLEALRLYNASSVAAHAENAQVGASPLQFVEELLLSAATDTLENHSLGCMGINAICEFGQSNAAVAAIGEASNREMLATLEQILRDAKAQDEVSATLDEKQAALFLNATLAGMKVRAKAGDNASQLRSVASFALQSLRI